jgi:hypothetical protein
MSQQSISVCVFVPCFITRDSLLPFMSDSFPCIVIQFEMTEGDSNVMTIFAVIQTAFNLKVIKEDEMSRICIKMWPKNSKMRDREDT